MVGWLDGSATIDNVLTSTSGKDEKKTDSTYEII